MVLIFWPVNMASVCCLRPDSSASCDEELEGFVGDAVLGVVEEEAGGFGGEAGAAGGVGGEEVAELLGAEVVGVLLEGDPGWAGGERGDALSHELALLWARERRLVRALARWRY